jgi:predicted porin
MKIKTSALATAIGAAVALASFTAQAEITVLKQNPQAGDPLSRLNFTVGGSIRPQFQNMTGNDGKNAFKRNGFDGGSRCGLLPVR